MSQSTGMPASEQAQHTTAKQKGSFASAYTQSNAHSTQVKIILSCKLFGFVWCLYCLRKVCHNKGKYILGT